MGGKFTTALSLAGGAWMAKDFYNETKAAGKNPSVMGAVGKAALYTALYELPLTAPLMWGKDMLEIGSAIGGAATEMWNNAPGANAQWYQPNMGGHFQDTEEGATMRRRGLAAIQSSQMNARSVLGSEARRLHR
jgi:hypothetical protein